jgi:CheY-like chemotaxis protein
MPRVLVVDDNPLSLRFFEDALSTLGLACTVAGSGAEALRQAALTCYDLLLIDACMPGMDGIAVLGNLREGRGASRSAPALASTAASAQAHAALRAAGFVDVVPKPIALSALHALLAAHLPGWNTEVFSRDSACLDDPRALAATGGDRSIVRALRGLLVLELDAVPDEFRDLAERKDIGGMNDRLHRLAASAGLCGAASLGRAVDALRNVLTANEPARDAALERLLAACAETRLAVGAISVEPASSAPTR